MELFEKPNVLMLKLFSILPRKKSFLWRYAWKKYIRKSKDLTFINFSFSFKVVYGLDTLLADVMVIELWKVMSIFFQILLDPWQGGGKSVAGRTGKGLQTAGKNIDTHTQGLFIGIHLPFWSLYSCSSGDRRRFADTRKWEGASSWYVGISFYSKVWTFSARV